MSSQKGGLAGKIIRFIAAAIAKTLKTGAALALRLAKLVLRPKVLLLAALTGAGGYAAWIVLGMLSPTGGDPITLGDLGEVSATSGSAAPDTEDLIVEEAD